MGFSSRPHAKESVEVILIFEGGKNVLAFARVFFLMSIDGGSE